MPAFMQPGFIRPGVYCLNDDLDLNARMIEDKDSDNDELVVPIFDPVNFAENHGELLLKDFELEEE